MNLGKKNHLFFVTSPRSPLKMIEEIRYLDAEFSGKKWDKSTQRDFFLGLSSQSFYEGSKSNHPDFSARDRINRAPKALGFVELKPSVCLTSAGERFLSGTRPHEALLRQLLKYQLPSPHHTDARGRFRIKPYLELMRMAANLQGLSKEEIAFFFMQLIDFRNSPKVQEQIVNFREEKKNRERQRQSYKEFIAGVAARELKKVFSAEVAQENFSTRQSETTSLEKFLKKKKANFLDYADAAMRYLRETGLFTVDPKRLRLVPIKEKVADIERCLESVERDPLAAGEDYRLSLADASVPALLSDDTGYLAQKIAARDSGEAVPELLKKSPEQLKDLYEIKSSEIRREALGREEARLRSYEDFEDIIEIFEKIRSRDLVDPSLFFEWNVWRAFVMLNDGEIKGNFRVDDEGLPLYPAAGNQADITCRYASFEATVEVTLSSGKKQHEMEGESVARHYGDLKRNTEKDAFCIFIAPSINEAMVAHSYGLYRSNISYYGGFAKLIPIPLSSFVKLLAKAKAAEKKPDSSALKKLWESIARAASSSQNEAAWHQETVRLVENFVF